MMPEAISPWIHRFGFARDLLRDLPISVYGAIVTDSSVGIR